MSEYIVELRACTKTFPGVVALDKMQLAVKPGGLSQCAHADILERYPDHDSWSGFLFGALVREVASEFDADFRCILPLGG